MDVVTFTRARLAPLADPDRAAKMQRYLKTDMVMLGVPHAELKKITREVARGFVPDDRDTWEDHVAALWAGPERELKYVAIGYARAFGRRRFLEPASLALIERMIREGAWWDLCDDIAANLLGEVLRRHRAEVRPVLERFIADDDLWIRRCAVLAQLKHKGDTDVDMLLDFCRRCAHERTFWMRKAIGWALRQHARTDPAVVIAFLDEMGDALSGLSRREASKHVALSVAPPTPAAPARAGSSPTGAGTR